MLPPSEPRSGSKPSREAEVLSGVEIAVEVGIVSENREARAHQRAVASRVEAGDAQLARRGRDQGRADLQQSGLAGAVWTHQRGGRSDRYLEIDGVEGAQGSEDTADIR